MIREKDFSMRPTDKEVWFKFGHENPSGSRQGEEKHCSVTSTGNLPAQPWPVSPLTVLHGSREAPLFQASLQLRSHLTVSADSASAPLPLTARSSLAQPSYLLLSQLLTNFSEPSAYSKR